MNNKPISVHEHHCYDKHPYYIYTPPYSEMSSGIRVLHYLCNILNSIGYEAYVSTTYTNPRLWTPALSEQVIARHIINKKKPIVIYPEVIRGTPLCLGIPVRFLLNKAGKIAGHTDFTPDEITISYRSAFANNSTEPLLHVPCSDPTIFHPPTDVNKPRKNCYFYFNRLLSLGGNLQPAIENAIEISPRNPVSREDLPNLLREAELLYCYEDGAITLEARMCGCPVVYLKNATCLPDYPEDALGKFGIAFGTSPSEIAEAKKTVAAVYPALQAHYDEFHVQLNSFINLTQSAAEETSFETCYSSILLPQPRANKVEKYWLKAHESEEVDGQIWAERMVFSWQDQPLFHFYIQFTTETQHLVDSTLAQFSKLLYPRWQVTVISNLPTPEGWGVTFPFQWLCLRNMADAEYVLNEMVSATSCDWVAELQPGIELDPHALLIAADYINQNPIWQFFDADEFAPNAPTGEASLRLNTGFDLDFLREHNHLGSLVMIQRDALLRAGGFGSYPLARSFDLALRVHEHVGSCGMGHIPHVLCTNQIWRGDADTLAQEQLALSDHFARLNISIDIQQSTAPNTRNITVSILSASKTTFVVCIEHALELLHPTLTALPLDTGNELLLVNTSGQQLVMPDELAAAGLAVRVIEASATQWPQNAAQHALNQWLFVMSPYTTPPTPDDLAVLHQTQAITGAAVVIPELNIAATPLSRPDHEWPNVGAPANPIRQYCTHAKLVANHLPLFVSKQVLLQHHGLDLTRHALADAWVDFSARISKAGHKIAATPRVRLHALTKTTPRKDVDGACLAQSRARLLDNHLSYLAQVTDTHPDLLLQKPQAIHHHMPRTWNVHANERPRILAWLTSTRADAPLRAWLLRLRAEAEAVVINVQTDDVQPDILAVARLSPHILVMDVSPSPAMLHWVQEVKAHLPHICTVVHIDALDFVTEREQTCTAYMQQVLMSCTVHADRLVTFSESTAASYSGLTKTLDCLKPDMPMPNTWWRNR